MNTSPLISAEELKKISCENLIILDARAGKEAHTDYLNNHIKGARFIDLEQHLAQVPEDAANGGRHPLPDLYDFAKTLSELGISEQSHVVIYDDKSGANAAARAWWMLKAFGIEKVQILDGGFQEAEKFGLEMSSREEHIHQTVVRIPEEWKLPTANIQEVENSIAENSATVIDVRDAYRYRGDSEPIDHVAGHIPGAINIPFSENLDENGLFLSQEQLRNKYSELLNNQPEKLIIHCGSGVTACHTIFALHFASFEMPKLYVGSWSEWSRRDKAIATEA